MINEIILNGTPKRGGFISSVECIITDTTTALYVEEFLINNYINSIETDTGNNLFGVDMRLHTGEDIPDDELKTIANDLVLLVKYTASDDVNAMVEYMLERGSFDVSKFADVYLGWYETIDEFGKQRAIDAGVPAEFIPEYFDAYKFGKALLEDYSYIEDGCSIELFESGAFNK